MHQRHVHFQKPIRPLRLPTPLRILGTGAATLLLVHLHNPGLLLVLLIGISALLWFSGHSEAEEPALLNSGLDTPVEAR
jgi:hypothetical protein